MEYITAGALNFSIAGTDTTSSTFAALVDHVVRTPGMLKKIQAELDSALLSNPVLLSFDQVMNLPYLEAIISESLRHHSSLLWAFLVKSRSTSLGSRTSDDTILRAQY